MEYYANFAANQSYIQNDLSSRNKNQLIKEIRAIAAGNRTQGNEARWYVYHKEGDNPICDAFGIIDGRGTYHRLREYEGELMY